MASLKDLLELSIQGDIGKLLIKTFGGELGRLLPRKDNEFLVVYPEGTKAPEATSIAKTVETHYRSLGYILDPIWVKNNCFQANVTLDGDEKFRCLAVVITTHFPFSGHHRCLAVATNPIDLD